MEIMIIRENNPSVANTSQITLIHYKYSFDGGS